MAKGDVHVDKGKSRSDAMSTPERSDDPGEHGYGGASQDYPIDEEREADDHRREDRDARARESADERTRADGFDDDEAEGRRAR